MKKVIVPVLAALIVAVTAGAHAYERNVDKVDPDKGVGLRSRLIETTATVEAIDQKERLATLKQDDTGEISVVKVDDSVKNLKKVKKGDRVTIQYYQSMVWNLIKNKNRQEPIRTVSQSKSSAEPGEKPSGVANQQIRLVADVEKVDKKAPSVTLKGPEGNSRTIIVRDAENLKNVKVGDQVDITYTEAVAVSVEKAKK